MPMTYNCRTWKDLAYPTFEPGATVQTLDDYVDALRAYVRRVKAEGAIGLKTASVPRKTPDRQAALEDFAALRDGKVKELPEQHALFDWVSDQVIAYGAEQGLVICVHTGYWGDFRKLDPLHIIPVLERHPNARFDLYHLGYPWVRESLMLAKNFSNVWLNFCWTHIISQKFASEAMDEAIDLIPQNKLIAFGADYNLPVEKVYGHLVMAREDMARALAGRLERGLMSEEQALDLAHKWFWDNPVALYNLAV
jgi:predicted TIM-barrel fold metal-dependent hydrolase